MWLDLTLRLPSEAGSVRAARRAVECALESVEVDRRIRDDVTLAVSEACSNVVQHAGRVRGYSISVVTDEDCCVVEVADDGRGVDPDRLTRRPLELSAERGRGLHIIRAVMDEVRISPSPTGGSIIRMVKRLLRHRSSKRHGAGSDLC
jgi:serine/threonine-protein kinase RsbW